MSTRNIDFMELKILLNTALDDMNLDDIMQVFNDVCKDTVEYDIDKGCFILTEAHKCNKCRG